MARPRINHEQKKALILTAAMRTFARYGYEGTTNKLIAAEVRRSTGGSFSPALIYHYFPAGKLQILETVVYTYQPIQDMSRVLHQESDMPPDVFLRQAAHAYITIFKDPSMVCLARIFFVEGAQHPELVQHMFGKLMPLVLLPMARYLQQQTALGRLRPINPFAAMFQFFGPLLIRVFATEIFRHMEHLPFPFPDDDQLIENHVQTFLHGLQKDDPAISEESGGV